MPKRKPARKGSHVYGRSAKADFWRGQFVDYVARHDRVRVTKRSELFDEDIEVYVNVENLEGQELSAYRVTPDYGEDVVASISAGYNVLPSDI